LPYHISELRLEGIRGFNKPVPVSFQKGVNLIYGPNGSGKSSLLQALEWCITGTMPYMKGGDFTREDAIVNLFHPEERATVTLLLEGIDPTLKLTRTRKMASTTTRGRQPLQLQSGKEAKKDEDAEKELAARLGISVEGFARTKYLHQEAIREALATKPEERSEAIDKLLGTFEIREFANALDTGRRLQTAAKNVETTIQSLEGEKIQFNLNLKRKLEESRKTLLARGFRKEELTLASAVDTVSSMKKQTTELRSALTLATHTYPPTSPNAQSLSDAQRKLLDEVPNLDRERMELLGKNQTRRLNLQHLSERYSSLLKSFADSKPVDTESLKKRVKEIDDELAGLNTKTGSLQKKASVLPTRRSTYEDLKMRLGEEEHNLELLEQKFGKEDSIDKRLSSVEGGLKECVDGLEQQSEQQRLIKVAIDILEKTLVANCPVCSQSIDNASLVAELKARTSKDIAINIRKLHDREKELKQQHQELATAKEDEQRLAKSIESLQKKFEAASSALSVIIEEKMDESVDLDVLLESWEGEQKSLLDRVGELRSEHKQVEETIKRQDQVMLDLHDALKQLRQETTSQAEGRALLERCAELQSQLEVESKKYAETTEIDNIRAKLGRLSDVLTLLRDEEAVEASDKEMPTISKQIEALKARKNSLQLLEGSLQSIRKLANEYEKETSIAQLTKLEDDINRFYSAILGHPYFSKLKVDIEKEEPLIYSMRATSANETTYIPTRFSTAQLNAAALAIFMSNSSQTTGELPLMILDDPTQSMDSNHKEALAKLIAKIATTYQVIVSTEDEETKNLLKKYCDGIRIYELGQWTTTGPNIKQST